jgi:hypothetical protein
VTRRAASERPLACKPFLQTPHSKVFTGMRGGGAGGLILRLPPRLTAGQARPDWRPGESHGSSQAPSRWRPGVRALGEDRDPGGPATAALACRRGPLEASTGKGRAGARGHGSPRGRPQTGGPRSTPGRRAARASRTARDSLELRHPRRRPCQWLPEPERGRLAPTVTERPGRGAWRSHWQAARGDLGAT